MAELGQLEKPMVESFESKRKLYCVSNVYPLPEAPADYASLIERYWNEVSLQTEKLELAGKVKKIFCESIYVGGDEAIKTLEKINEKALPIVKKKIEDGAVLFPLENKEIFGPYLDWANCLRIVRTPEVFTQVFEFFTGLSDKRFQHIMKTIEDSLQKGEAGMLIMRDEDRAKLQFPADIEVFLITPPSYDDILRWLRDKMKDVNIQE